MNFLQRYYSFNDKVLSGNPPLSPSSIALFNAICNIYLRNGNPSGVEIEMNLLMKASRLSKSSILRERNFLKEHRFISFEKRGGNNPTVYCVTPLAEFLYETRECHSEAHESHSGTRECHKETHECHTGTHGCHSGTAEHIRNSNTTHPEGITTRSATGKRQHSSRVYISINKNIDKDKGVQGEKKKSSSSRKSRHLDVTAWLCSVEEPWRSVMRQWLEYKSQKRENYSSELSLKKLLTQLKNYSWDNPETAQMIVDRSITNNWKGLFPLGNCSAPKGTPIQAMPPRGQHIGQIMLPKDEAERKEVLDRFRSKTNKQ